MKRLLLFDSGCTLCRELAQAVEKESDGRLAVRSLREAEVQRLLDQARPGWSWEPTLLEVEGKNTKAYTGIAMLIRMAHGLGLRRAWRVARLVSNITAQANGEINQARRRFLKYGGGIIGLALLPFGRQVLPTDLMEHQGRVGSDWRSHLVVKKSQELTGEKLEQARARFNNAPDVNEIIGEHNAAAETEEHKAVMHTLEDNNTLLAIGATLGNQAVLYYALAEPVANVRTAAYLYELDGERVRLVSFSINGKAATLQEQPAMDICGGCVDPVNGPFHHGCTVCSGSDWGCAAERCAACMIPCAAGITAPCIVCLVVWCPYWVFFGCCTSWDPSCCGCLAP
jgi:predicted DCC family thiol-disulfide oxidoreductase YuxK